MDIQRFKDDHVDILQGIDRLRKLSKSGIAGNAHELAAGVEALSKTVVQHLAIEDRILYPRLENSANDHLVALSKKFQEEMKDVAHSFIVFTRKWKNPTTIERDPEGFRNAANIVLKHVHQRIAQENREFYPVVEAAH